MINVFPPPPVDANGNPETIYPVSALSKFPGRMRQAGDPPYDPNWKIQGWNDPNADTSDPDNVYVYNTLNVGKDGTPIVDSQGKCSLKQVTIPAARAATVNLPGVATFPPFSVSPTMATRGGQPMNPLYLASPAQAQALVDQLNAAAGVTVCTGLIDAGSDGDAGNAWMPIVYPTGDDRRMFIFSFKQPAGAADGLTGPSVLNEFLQYVGLLLLTQNAVGVGSPGHWDCSGPAPIWISTPAPSGPRQWTVAQSQPVPLRPLIPITKDGSGNVIDGETIHSDPFMGVFVRRSIS